MATDPGRSQLRTGDQVFLVFVGLVLVGSGLGASFALLRGETRWWALVLESLIPLPFMAYGSALLYTAARGRWTQLAAWHLQDWEREITVDDLTQSVPRLAQVAAGTAVGVLGLILAVWLAVDSVPLIRQGDTAGLAWLALGVFTGCVTTLIAFRLFTRRGARRGGGVLTPWGYSAFGLFIAAIAVIVATPLVREKGWEFATEKVAGMLLLSVGCFYIAWWRSARR